MVKRIAVTGGSGQIAYSLLFRIASGELFGQNTPIALHLLELPTGLESLKGIVMELEDCGFPNLKEIVVGSNPEKVFEGVNIAILVGPKPRASGMERKDLLEINGEIFVKQGKALNKSAAKDVLVFVVGNPCNTNCLIAMHNAPDIPNHQFHAMTRLDQNRAQFQLASKARVKIKDVKNIVIWGNHSATQVPDYLNAQIKGQKAPSVITDHEWLKNEFIDTVQKRGADIIKVRGKSSAASAANAILMGIKSLHEKNSDVFSSCILSDGNAYGIQEGLIFSFPCKIIEPGKVQIVDGFERTTFFNEKIAFSEKELLEERDSIRHFLS